MPVLTSVLNCRQPFLSHAIQFSGVEKGEVANGHNENNSKYIDLARAKSEAPINKFII